MIPLDDAPAAGGRRAAVREREDAVTTALRSLGSALDGEPDPGFRAATRARLVAMAAVRSPQPAPPRPRLARLLAPRTSPVRRRLTAGLAGAALAVTALATLVAVAAGAHPGDPLYGLKRGTEQTQLALSGSDRGLTLLGFARTRLSELGTLTGSADTPLAVSTLQAMDDETTRGAAAVATRAVAGADPAAAGTLATWGTQQSAGLAALRPQLPAGAQPALDRSAALAAGVRDRGTALAAALQCATGPAVGPPDALGPAPLPCGSAAAGAPTRVAPGTTGTAPGPGPAVPAAPSSVAGSPAGGGSTSGSSAGAGGTVVGGTGSGGSGAGSSSTGRSGPGGLVPGVPVLPSLAPPTVAAPTTSGAPLLPLPSTGLTLPGTTPAQGSGSTGGAGSTGGHLLPGLPVCVPPLPVGSC